MGMFPGHPGAFYQGYRRLMAHWRTHLRTPMITFSYERLVTDPEPAIRRLLEFCGLEWDPRCLQPEASVEYRNTASYAQVRRSIYTSSVDRAARYRRHLEPLIEILGELVEPIVPDAINPLD